MARKSALLRLRSRLVSRRAVLLKALACDWESRRKFGVTHEVGDIVDAALDSTSDEISSRVVDIESRELEQIEHALQRIAKGVYERCEYCGAKVAEARLHALPYTNSCIDCQRVNERNGAEHGSGVDQKSWAGAFRKPSLEESDSDSYIRLSDFEMDLSELR